jgi:pimeloyl-ACP methyl ester carboxylesterase
MHIKNILVIIGGGTLILTFILVAVILKKDSIDQGGQHTITTADGLSLVVKEYPVSKAKMVSVLLPNSGQSQTELFSVAQALQSAKIAAVTFDWRGQQDGTNKTFSNADWLKGSADVEAVVAFAHKQYPNAQINLFGGDFGADMAIHYAAAHADVNSVVALSLKPTTKGLSIVDDMSAYQGPIFVMEYVVNPDDEELLGRSTNGRIVEPGGDLFLLSKNADSYYLVYPSKASGWSMVTTGQSQLTQIIQWMNARL